MTLIQCDALCLLIKRSTAKALITEVYPQTGQPHLLPGKLMQEFMQLAQAALNMGLYQLQYNYQFNPVVNLFLDYAYSFNQACSAPVVYMQPLEAYARIFNDLRIAANDQKFLANVQNYQETIHQNQRATQQRFKDYHKVSSNVWMIFLETNYQHMQPSDVAGFDLIGRLEHHRIAFADQLQQFFSDQFIGLEWALELPINGSLRYQMILILTAPDSTKPVNQDVIAQYWHEITIQGYPVRRTDSQLVACHQARPLLVRAGDLEAIKEARTRLTGLHQAHYLTTLKPDVFGKSTGFFQNQALLKLSQKPRKQQRQQR